MEPNRLIWILIYALVILSPTNAADFVLEIYGNANMDEHLDQADLDYIRAVSYTHLRAHETVLDLVCRLLLEKKKKNDEKKKTNTTHRSYKHIQ